MQSGSSVVVDELSEGGAGLGGLLQDLQHCSLAFFLLIVAISHQLFLAYDSHSGNLSTQLEPDDGFETGAFGEGSDGYVGLVGIGGIVGGLLFGLSAPGSHELQHISLRSIGPVAVLNLLVSQS